MQWKAVYKDDSSISQKDGFKYTDINRDELEFFELYKEDKLVFRLHLEPGRNLVFRRRVSRPLFSDKIEAVYLVGWQMRLSDRNIQSISYLFEDGRIEMAGQFREGTAWFYPVKFLKEEDSFMMISGKDS